MIIEGLKLTLLGMGVVFAFLALLVIVVQIATKVLKPLTDKEASALAIRQRKKPRSSSAKDNGKKMAVISAAITAHKARTRIDRNS